MSGPFAILTTSVATYEEGRAIARALVERRLAGCVQILPIQSVYRWNEAIEEAAEHCLVCKVRQTDIAAVEAAITALHAYDVPEIVVTPAIHVGSAYAAWLSAATLR